MNQPLRQQGMVFVDALRDPSSFIRQMEIAVLGDGDVFTVFHIFYGD